MDRATFGAVPLKEVVGAIMADNPASNAPVQIAEIIPSVAGDVSGVASANAPFIYFDGTPTFGFNEGIANITLEALRYVHANGKVVSDKVIVAHLRTSVSGMMPLKAAIEGVVLLTQPVEKPEGKTN
jgi:hypothetical protein